MAERNLPIKVFHKRTDVDERKTEGGGSNTAPSWLLSDDELFIRSKEFRDVLSETSKIISSRKKEREFIPAVIKVSIHEEAVAKTHRKEVNKIFNPNQKYNVIGLSGEREILVKVDTVEDLKKVDQRLEKTSKFAHGISAITEIEQFSPYIEIPEEDNISLKVKLMNYQNYQLNQSVEKAFEDSLNKLNISFKKTHYTSDLTVFKLSDVGLDTIEDIKDFEAIFSITKMPKYGVGLDSIEGEDIIPVRKPTSGEEYPVVGVLDSGIAKISHLSPWLLEKSFSSVPLDMVDQSHGTFVAGIILYGDTLEGKDWTGFKGCKLFDAIVFPDPKKENIDEDTLIESIREAISQNSDIKIWNLSGGGVTECGLNDFSDFGKALDDIQDRYNVIICKSAGNCRNFIKGAPKLRIPNSADSIRSLVVGSIAHAKGEYDLAEVGHPSPFSRTGHGPNNLIKPDLVHYGGNAGTDVNGKFYKTGVNSFNTYGKVVCNIGTSFSTPRVTSLLAGINHHLNEEFNHLLLKALSIHSAKYPENLDLSLTERLKQMGFGLPEKVDNILYNVPNEITLILQDSIVKGNFIEILDFPFPENLVENGFYYGEIILTLVNTPILNGNQGAEYCQSDLKVSFGTYDQVKERDTRISTVINEIGAEGAKNLLNAVNYGKRYLKTHMGKFATERLLRNYSGKYHPTKKYAINLEELTAANRERGLKHPKKWFLRIEGLINGFAEDMAIMDGEELSQEFCLIITIRDTKNYKNVYDSVTRQLDTNNFLHQNLKIRNQVQVAVSGNINRNNN